MELILLKLLLFLLLLLLLLFFFFFFVFVVGRTVVGEQRVHHLPERRKRGKREMVGDAFVQRTRGFRIGAS